MRILEQKLPYAPLGSGGKLESFDIEIMLFGKYVFIEGEADFEEEECGGEQSLEITKLTIHEEEVTDAEILERLAKKISEQWDY